MTITRRDLFAAAALQGLLARGKTARSVSQAWELAEQMIRSEPSVSSTSSPGDSERAKQANGDVAWLLERLSDGEPISIGLIRDEFPGTRERFWEAVDVLRRCGRLVGPVGAVSWLQLQDKPDARSWVGTKQRSGPQD